MKIKLGFTMAEAILVMTILGIIATIMISTLKPAEFKEKGMQVMAKKVLSELDVATTQILMNNTADGTLLSVYAAGTSNIISYGTHSVEECGNALGSLYKSYLTTLRKNPIQTGYGYNAFLLKDGASVGITFWPYSSNYCGLEVFKTMFPGETEAVNLGHMCGYIFFDINDNEPPNILGKDQFKLPLDMHGIKYAE